jgi:hypothetical protein
MRRAGGRTLSRCRVMTEAPTLADDEPQVRGALRSAQRTGPHGRLQRVDDRLYIGLAGVESYQQFASAVVTPSSART